MIRKKFLIVLLSFCVFCNCACGQERPKQGWQYEPEVIPDAPETGYQIEECTLEDMEQPAGICRFQDKIVVSDKEKHCLFVLNPDGELLKCIGALGGGQVEFMQPTGLTVHDGRLYVLDAGNDRIQILDGDFQFVESITLGALVHKQGDHFYIDIAVDEDGIIYVSTDSAGRLDSFLYVVEDGEVSHLETPFVGYLEEYNGEVYAADSMELNEEDGEEIGQSGSNSLYKIKNKKMEKISQLPNKMTPNDFCNVKGEFFMLSAAWGTLVRMDKDGENAESVLKLENANMGMYLAYIEEKDVFYLSDLSDKKLYRIYK